MGARHLLPGPALLLHGLPSSSRMFQPLLTRLSDSYHLAAPDYPGCVLDAGHFAMVTKGDDVAEFVRKNS
jgi:pimeloyl-ACP methyl ester carboxylesterase